MSRPHSKDAFRVPHAVLVERVVLMRSALKDLAADHASLHRSLRQARAENEAMRAALAAHRAVKLEGAGAS
jgi:hypothetical protein